MVGCSNAYALTKSARFLPKAALEDLRRLFASSWLSRFRKRRAGHVRFLFAVMRCRYYFRELLLLRCGYQMTTAQAARHVQTVRTVERNRDVADESHE